MPSVIASSYVSISTAVAYTTPFLGALLADRILGEYTTILVGCLLCYIPGLLLIAFTTIPLFLGNEFNRAAINWGLLVLWPMGTGMVKACVNVFGAKQFHPILQSSFIESYYVNFYMCINIGALTGGIIVPVVAQWNVTVAYFIPVCMLGLGVVLFGAGTGRYVRPRPAYDVGRLVCDAMSSRGCGGRGRTTTSRSKRDRFPIQPSKSSSVGEGSRVGIGTIALLSGLVVPFNVAYAQMATTFIVQGSVMRNVGIVDAPMMNNADAVSVLAFGYLIGNVIYPELNRRGIKIPTTYKFAIGSAFGAWAVGCAIVTDYRIHRVYRETGEAITVLWQVFPYLLIGIGEIFAVSAAYELAFTVAPVRMKSIASAANLFMVGGLPNVLCILLYNACSSWFLNANGEARIHKLRDYASARVVNCFWVVEAISLFGVLINVLPRVKDWVADIEASAAETIRSPMSTPVIRKNLMLRKRKEHRRQQSSGTMDDEESPLIKSQKHAQYLKFGAGPSLNKFGSMRAGPSIRKAPVGSGDAAVPASTSLQRPPKSPRAIEDTTVVVGGLELMS
jgi:POT family proton-dependent oligopeptide transporter